MTSVHLSHQHALVGKDASIAHTAVSLGGGVVRVAPSVRYAGPGGNAELRGLYFADAGQHLEHRLLVDHAEPNCRSRVTYKGALQGDGAHAVWIGDVIIRPEAVGTDSYESNRNLVLTDGTRVDSVPNLEILTGEVTRAGHASTSGRLEDAAPVLPDGAGYPAGRGAAPGDQGLLRRADRPDRGTRTARADHRRGGGGAGEGRMTRVRPCLRPAIRYPSRAPSAWS